MMANPGVVQPPVFGRVGLGTSAGAMLHGTSRGGVATTELRPAISGSRWHGSREFPAAATARRRELWHSHHETTIGDGDIRSIEAQLATLFGLDHFVPSDVVRGVLRDEAAVADHRDSTMTARQQRGLRGALATLPPPSADGAPTALYLSGESRLDTVLSARVSIGRDLDLAAAARPPCVLAQLENSALEVVAQGYGVVGPGVYTLGAVAIRSHSELYTLAAVPQFPNRDSDTDGERSEMWGFEVRHMLNDMPARTVGVTLNPVMQHECVVALESGQLIQVAEKATLLPAPTGQWRRDSTSRAEAVGCEFGHHPQVLCMAETTCIGLRDLRASASACWRPLWDVKASHNRRLASMATLRSRPPYFVAATSEGLSLLDARRPGQPIWEWIHGGGRCVTVEPAAFIDTGTLGGGCGGATEFALTCSINTATTLGYGMGTRAAPTVPRATPTWGAVAGTSQIGPFATGLPEELGTVWDPAAEDCPALNRDRWRSPTVGFAAVPLPQSGADPQSLVALRSTASGDLFARVCCVAPTTRAAVAVVATLASDVMVNRAWTSWASSTRTQEVKRAGKTATERGATKRARVDGRTPAKLCTTPNAETTTGAFETAAMAPLALSSAPDPALSETATLPRIEALVMAKGPHALHEIKALFESEAQTIDLTTLVALISTSTKLRLLEVSEMQTSDVLQDLMCAAVSLGLDTPSESASTVVASLGSYIPPRSAQHNACREQQYSDSRTPKPRTPTPKPRQSRESVGRAPSQQRYPFRVPSTPLQSPARRTGQSAKKPSGRVSGF